MALLTSLVALSIDAMLPALPEIGVDLDVRTENGTQLVVAALFVGFSIGQLFYGPISDSVGRKPPIYFGLGLFMLGTVFAMTASNFTLMLVGRVLQGLGAGAPRVVCVALIRDQYEGRAMARVMSFVMAIFILVPMLAPALGQGVMFIADWRAIFGLLLILSLTASVWFGARQVETLDPARRIPFSCQRVGKAIVEVFRDRFARGYSLAAGLLFGSFIGYLNSSQQIFQSQFGVGTSFPLYFGALAFTVGLASVLNGKLVMRVGMRALSRRALAVASFAATAYLVYAWIEGGTPSLWSFMTWGSLNFFCIGFVFGNFNTMAIESLGHIAGVATSIIGSVTTMIALLLGLVIGQSFNGTILPLVGGFAVLETASLLTMFLTERGTRHVEKRPI